MDSKKSVDPAAVVPLFDGGDGFKYETNTGPPPSNKRKFIETIVWMSEDINRMNQNRK